FFFQAEDGIRVFHVTGVQTCALPISGVTVHNMGGSAYGFGDGSRCARGGSCSWCTWWWASLPRARSLIVRCQVRRTRDPVRRQRSEKRRGGRDGRDGGVA